MKHWISRVAASTTFLIFSTVGSAEQNWPQFRGPGSTGVVASNDVALPDTWSETDHVAWKVPVAGIGWSSPVVWGDRIYLTSAVSKGEVEAVKAGLYFGGERPEPKDEHEWHVLCLELATGKTIWDKTVHTGVPQGARHLKNSYASETPVVDGERVYAYFGNVGFFTFDLNGKELWNRKWEPVKTRHGWGTAASPCVHKDRIYVVNDNDGQSFLVALDKATGEVIWRQDRDEGSNWSPPFVWENALRTEIVTTGSGKVRSYDLDGNVLWTLSGLSSITVTEPFAYQGLLFFGSGYVGDKRKPFFAMKPGASGDVSLAEDETSNAFIVWCQKKAAPYMPTPVIYQDRLYVLLDQGLMSCYNAKTGEQIYDRERLGKSRQFTASPLVWNDKVFCFGERGETIVLQAGSQFKMLFRNELDGLIMATPAVAGHSLLIRTAEHLYCIRELPEG